jgi:hypothetical protein
LGQLRLRHLSTDAGDFGRSFGESLVAFLILGDVEKKTCLLEIRAMFRPGVNDAFEGGLLPQNPLSFIRVVPEIRLIGELA